MLVFSIIASALKKSETELGDELGRGQEAILDGMVSKGLSPEVTLSRGVKEARREPRGSVGEALAGRGKGWCQPPDAGVCLTHPWGSRPSAWRSDVRMTEEERRVR